MARLLIVSRSMALAMRLADQHDVVEHPADELDNLLPNLDADVLVLDLGDPVLAVNTVNSLREADQVIPVLLVSGYQPEWEQVEAHQVDGVHVVSLPITRMALLQGVAVLTGEDAPIAFLPADDVESQVLVPAVDEDTPGDTPAPSEPSELSEPDGSDGPDVVPDSDPSDPVAADAASTGTGSTDAGSGDDAHPRTPITGRTPGTPLETGEIPEITRSDVAGLSYSTSITRPFDQEPRTGQVPIPPPPAEPPAPAPRWSRSSPVPDDLVTPGDPLPGTTNGNAMARRMQRLGNRPRKLQRRSGPIETPASRTPTGAGVVSDPLGPRTDPNGFPMSDLDRRLDAEAAALVTRGGTETGFALRTSDLVRMLHERSSDLYSVSDTAQVLADDVIERADADAAAVLIPDGPVWRVSGGVGLRPLERRLELTESHWLITEIGSAGRAVLIEDTDIIRQQLAGAPLAAWRHLLAVPVPDIRGIVVLARGQEAGPFTDRDLSAVIAPVREAASLLAQAVEIRRLARLLSPLRESEADSRRSS